MRRPGRQNRDRAERDGHRRQDRDLWKARPRSGVSKTTYNKRISMRLWRRSLRRQLLKQTNEE